MNMYARLFLLTLSYSIFLPLCSTKDADRWLLRMEICMLFSDSTECASRCANISNHADSKNPEAGATFDRPAESGLHAAEVGLKNRYLNGKR